MTTSINILVALGLMTLLDCDAQMLYSFSKPRERDYGPGCLTSGVTYQYQCVIPSTDSALVWRGGAFYNQCPDPDSTATDDRITFHVSEPTTSVSITCGDFTAQLSRGTSDEVLSNLTFVATKSLNSQTINCTVPQRYADDSGLIGYDVLRIGERPLPPENLTLAFPNERRCDFNWRGPSEMDESDFDGYDIKLYGDCGVCTPNTSSTGRLPANVTTYTCIGWTPEDQTCRFEVRTVSKDCQLLSILSNYSVILDNTPPNITALNLQCSRNLSYPKVYVDWELQRIDTNQIDAADRLPRLLDFWVIMSDSASTYNYTVPSMFRSITTPDTTVADGNNVTVTVWHRNQANPSGVNRTVCLEVSPIHSELNVNDSTCIKIAIDNMCLECTYSFYANVTIRNGTCDDTNVLVTTELVQFDNDYTVCVPIMEILETSACYNASIYYKSGLGKEYRVGTTSQRDINLESCDMSYVSSNKAVLHNSVTTDGVATHCVNGTLVPASSSSDSDSGLSPSISASIALAVLLLIALLSLTLLLIILLVLIYKWKHTSTEQAYEVTPLKSTLK